MPVRRREAISYEGDPLIPIMNLVCMLIPLLLYGAVFVRFVTIDVKQPNIGPIIDGEKDGESLDLTVMITDQGFHFKVRPTHRLPWMSQETPDIPRKDSGWDFAALGEKLWEIKKLHRQETRIILGAEDNIAFDILIKAMDSARGTDQDVLFPDVTLTRGLV